MEMIEVTDDALFEEADNWAGVVEKWGYRLSEQSERRGWDFGGSGSEGECLNNRPCFCPQVALEMLFTGEPITAQEALLHGLLSRVVPEEQLEEETMRIATKIASLSRPVVSLGKAAFYKQLPQDLRTAYYLTCQTMVDNVALRDGQEGIKAFIQKRKPMWSH